LNYNNCYSTTDIVSPILTNLIVTYENKEDSISGSNKQTNHLVENNKYVLFTNIFILLLEVIIPFIKSNI